MGIPLVVTASDRSFTGSPIRALVAALHVVVGALVVLDGALVVLQVRINLAWEFGFYGEGHPMSWVLLLGGVLAVVFGTVAGLASTAWAFDRLRGPWVLLDGLILMCFVEEPIAWALLLASWLVVGEQWADARRRRRERDGD